MCGSCSMTAAGCSHPGGDFSGPCPTAKGMLQEAEQHIAKGETDERVMQAFVQEFGTTVYAEPPKSGFSLVDRKSTRLNSSHGYISYAVFCLKKKNRPSTYIILHLVVLTVQT